MLLYKSTFARRIDTNPRWGGVAHPTRHLNAHQPITKPLPILYDSPRNAPLATPHLIPMRNALLQRQNCLLQLPNPSTNPPLHLLSHRTISAPDNPVVKLQQPIQLLPRSQPVSLRIRSVLLRLLGRKLELITRRAVHIRNLLNRVVDGPRRFGRG